MSLDLTCLPLTLYIEPFSRSIFLEISISSNWLKLEGAFFSVLSNFIETSAKFLAGRSLVPEKIISSIPSPRICLAEFSPITHFIASTILDFPQPLGPTIPVKPLSIGISVDSKNDLNPDILMDLNFIQLPFKKLRVFIFCQFKQFFFKLFKCQST